MGYLELLQAFVGLYGIPASLGLICFIVLGVLSIFVISLLTKTPIAIGLGFFKLNFGSKNNISNKASLISSLLEYQESYIRNTVEAETNCFKRQMNYCEQKLQELKFLVLNNYSSLLVAELGPDEDVKNHRDFKSYQILISILIKELMEKVFYPLLIQNHLEDMDENSWKNYVNDKINFIFNVGTDFADNMYGSGKTISRQECYESEKKLSPDIKLILREVFDHVKVMAIENKNDLRKEKEESENRIKEICKNNGLSLEE